MTGGAEVGVLGVGTPGGLVVEVEHQQEVGVVLFAHEALPGANVELPVVPLTRQQFAVE